MHTFLESTVTALVELSDQGIPVEFIHTDGSKEKKTVKAYLLMVLADGPGKAKLMGFWGPRSANGGCNRCDQKPVHRKRLKKSVWLYIPKRTQNRQGRKEYNNQQEMLQQTDKVKTISEFSRLSYFDLVQQVPLDAMHVCWLGVVGKFMEAWFKEKKKPWSIKINRRYVFGVWMNSIRPPTKFSRQPRAWCSGWKGIVRLIS